jgi:hypothetical protein
MEKDDMKNLYLSLLLFLFLIPDEALAQCVSSIGFDTRVSGNWVSNCTSTHSAGRYAKYYTFNLSSTQEVTIDLESSTDPVLFLLNGSDQTGTVIATNDDINNNNKDSRIIHTLSAGTYTIEATTWAAGTTGSFFVSLSASTTPIGDCVNSISFNTNVSGSWESKCTSTHSAGSYAKYYIFTLSSTREVTIDLESSTDPVLFLLNGSGQSGTVIATNDDISSNIKDSRIISTLSAGTYTIEATTYNAGSTGNFVVSVTTGTPTSDGCVNSINLNTEVSGSWSSSCESEHKAGHYAKYYTFSLSSTREVTIDLESSTDPILYLLSGSGKTGTVLEINDDISNSNKDSRIITFLSAGTYTIEATTYDAGSTGNFVISVSVSAPPPGSLPFVINAGLNDAWYNPATNRQGFLITVYPISKQMFVTWFTFDTERPSEDAGAQLGEPGHRWLTAQGPYDGDTANLTIYLTKGGVFDAADPPASTDQAGIGTMIIEFADCNEALITYDITSPDISGEVPIQRIVSENVPACELLVEQLQ